MDVSAFSGGTFDPRDWINLALRVEEPQGREAAAGGLVMRLQLMIARVNSALEEQCQAVVQAVPRLVREAEQLEQEAALLRDKLVSVKKDVARVEAETAGNMSSLVLMDTVKERVAMTRRALQEADNWSSLDGQAEDAFEADALDTVAARLAGMAGSLRLLAHTEDYRERVAHLEHQRNRLEATLSPQLVTAFTCLDTEAACRLVAMFRGMERGEQLAKYYTKCVRAGLAQRWAVILAEGEGEASRAVATFYTELATRLRQHRTWVCSVFPDSPPGDLMASLLTSTLSSLDPSIDYCLESAAKLATSELVLLVEARAAADTFLAGLAEVLEGASEGNLVELGKAVYKPFRAPVARYGDMEGRALQGEVGGWSTSGKDTIEEVHSLVSCVARLAQVVEAAATRCSTLTSGCGFPGLAAAVARGLDSHLDRYRRIMRRLEKRKVVADDDWSVLQHCLSANQATGDLLLQLEALDVTLSVTFTDLMRPLLGGEPCPPLLRHHTFLCDEVQMEELALLYSAVTAKAGSATPMLHQALGLLAAACADLQKTTFAVMFHPVSAQLELVPGLQAWGAATSGQGTLETAMPEFSYSPSEYITCVGEYLMTLPQHLEPYMSQDNPALSRAFRESVFPGSSGTSPASSPADFLLSCIAASTCSSYLSYISSIPATTPNSSRQLGVDVSYLGEILGDLGITMAADLHQVGGLAKVSPEGFRAEAAGKGGKAVALVARLRGIAMD